MSNLVHVAVAYLIALPIGWDRERSGEGVGLRTFPLVAVASCGYLLIARDLAIGNEDAQSRVLQGLLGGIGFIGGGAILKEGGTVRGTATAASIWNTAAIGVAVAFDRFEIAIVLGVINFLTLQWSKSIKRAVDAGVRTATERVPGERREIVEGAGRSSGPEAERRGQSRGTAGRVRGPEGAGGVPGFLGPRRRALERLS